MAMLITNSYLVLKEMMLLLKISGLCSVTLQCISAFLHNKYFLPVVISLLSNELIESHYSYGLYWWLASIRELAS